MKKNTILVGSVISIPFSMFTFLFPSVSDNIPHNESILGWIKSAFILGAAGVYTRHDPKHPSQCRDWGPWPMGSDYCIIWMILFTGSVAEGRTNIFPKTNLHSQRPLLRMNHQPCLILPVQWKGTWDGGNEVLLLLSRLGLHSKDPRAAC